MQSDLKADFYEFIELIFFLEVVEYQTLRRERYKCALKMAYVVYSLLFETAPLE